MGKLLNIATIVTLSLCSSQCQGKLEQKLLAAEVAKTSKDYFAQVIEGDKTLSKLIATGKLAHYISEELTKLEHFTPKGYPQSQDFGHGDMENQEKPSEGYLKNFKQFFLTDTYFLLQALKDIEFRKELGRELEADTKDKSSEHGGVLRLLPNGKVKIEVIPSYDGPNMLDDFGFGHRQDPDSTYTPTDIKYTLDVLNHFHFHARLTDHSESAVLSAADYWYGGVVFTRVGGNKFNVDATLFYEREDKKVIKVNIDLGIYQY
ncbi:MAG: hypothetical protein V2A62_03575 [Candidatus Woesearchaeota archaeon]